MAFAGWAVVIVLLALGAPAEAQQALPDGLQFTRIKPADPEMRRLIVEGYRRSETFRRLADEIQQSSALVIVQYGQCANGRFRSCVTNVDRTGVQRNVRVKINTRVNDDRLVATIAHELYHVLEILREPDVVDADTTVSLYRRIGTGQCRQGLSEACETDAALAMEARVLDEISRASRR